jgi:hypothetical protein
LLFICFQLFILSQALIMAVWNIVSEYCICCSFLFSCMKLLNITWYTIYDEGRHLGTSTRKLLYELIELASFQGNVGWMCRSVRLLLSLLFTSLDTTSVPYFHMEFWETKSVNIDMNQRW